MASVRPSRFRSLRAAALLFAAAALIGAARPAPPEPNSLQGQLLIAAPTIGDPRFYHAVILVVRDDKDGAFGIVINRPAGERSIKSLLDAIAGKAGSRANSGIEGEVPVFAGGPVEPELGFIVHSAEYRRAGTLEIDSRIALTASPQVLIDIGHHRGPKKSLFALGYAGWGPGQLAAEMARHDWFTTPAAVKLVFDADRGSLWEDAMARRTREL